MIEVVTQHPIALDSQDHINPEGTKNDNYSDARTVQRISELIGPKGAVIDLGCSGGQFIVDMHNAGHIAVGLEGSDYSIVNARANWPEYHGKILFACDISKPFTVMNDGGRQLFDAVTAWEFFEHIAEGDDLQQVLQNIVAHTKAGSWLIASISLGPGPWHPTIHDYNWWSDVLAPWFDPSSEGVHNFRSAPTSFMYVGRRK